MCNSSSGGVRRGHKVGKGLIAINIGRARGDQGGGVGEWDTFKWKVSAGSLSWVGRV